jgi:hypothetical protein
MFKVGRRYRNWKQKDVDMDVNCVTEVGEEMRLSITWIARSSGRVITLDIIEVKPSQVDDWREVKGSDYEIGGAR